MSPTRFQWFIRAAILLLVLTVLVIGVIASGNFDPAPVGTRLWRLDDEGLSPEAETRDIIWLDEQVPDSPITIRVTAAHSKGAKDVGYGLVFGDEDAYLAVAVSPLGYLAIWQSDVRSSGSTDSYLLEWQTWPHVKTEDASNEIWVDIVGSRAGVRINREWLWEGEIIPSSGNVGLLAESFTDPAVIDFQTTELFAKSDK